MLPPTDSIYKFAAIAGLLIICTSLLYFWRYMMDLIKNLPETSLRIKTLKLKAEHQLERAKHVNEVLEICAQKRNGTYIPGSCKLEFDYSDDELKRLMIECDDRALEIRLTHEENLHLEAEDMRQVSAIKAYRFMLWMSVLTGTVMMIWGFLNWYYKYQIYVDKSVINGQVIQVSDPPSSTEKPLDSQP